MTCPQTPQECQGSKKKSLKRKQQHLPSPLLRCQLPFTKPAVGSTVCSLNFLVVLVSGDEKMKNYYFYNCLDWDKAGGENNIVLI